MMCCREGTLNEDGGRWAGTHKPARCGHTGSWSFCIVITQPEVDTPAVLHAYATRLGVDLASWAFVTGHPQAVPEVWQAFGITVKPRAKRAVEHPAWTFLLDQAGMVWYRYLGSRLEVETMLEDVRPLW